MKHNARLLHILSVITGLLLLANVANAETPSDYTDNKTGVVTSVNYTDRILNMDDDFYAIAKDVVVMDSKGQPIRLSAVYRGRKVRMEVRYSGSGPATPVIQTIYIMK